MPKKPPAPLPPPNQPDTSLKRCPWCAASPLYTQYHDTEWGIPVDDDRKLYEKICLEGFQAGLSWQTILNKRESFRRAFKNFDMKKVAAFDENDITRLLGDADIVRHRGKIVSTINNAARAIELRKEFGSLAAFIWQFEPPHTNRPKKMTLEILRTMTTSPESIALSKALKKRGWSFVGPTTMYAFMQSVGLVNDHLHDCSARAAALAARAGFKKP
ncbi:MAG: 3-methyladenine glycosylase [Herbaspirillum sp.]|jgi:DNA-3-methyladenine glycosylase I|nr:3-methyladenine glycosylase [Herbaspirillum sp.]